MLHNQIHDALKHMFALLDFDENIAPLFPLTDIF
jgi:hypothetical protein